jgi:hypothetical protein
MTGKTTNAQFLELSLADVQSPIDRAIVLGIGVVERLLLIWSDDSRQN